MPIGGFSGDSRYVIDADAALSYQDPGGSVIYWRVIATKNAGTGYWSGASGANNGIADSNLGRVWTGGGFGYDFRGSTPKSILIADGTFYIPHDAAGNAVYAFSAGLNLNNGIGNANAGTGWRALPRIPKVPSQTNPIGLDQITPTSMRYRFGEPGDHGGTPITQYQVSYSTGGDPNAGTIVGSAGATVISPLIPATTYNVWSRAANAVGWGPWSAVATASTVPASAPGISVSPSPSGGGATVTLTPPTGATSVTNYTFEREYLTPPPLPGTPLVSTTVTSSPATVSGLAPGATYRWRAQATIGAWTSPWSDWVTVEQPAPSTNPGRYYDGGTPADADTAYAWTATAENSTSQASSPAPVGWTTFAEGSAVSGGEGAVSQASEAYVGSFAARAIFFADATAAGFELGQATSSPARSEVAEGGFYWGAPYVTPSKSQRLAAVMIWMDAAGAPFARTIGTPEVVPSGAYERLPVSGQAPLGARYGVVRVIDVTGTGWSLWRGGDALYADALHISLNSLPDYFDGNTPDTYQYDYAWTGPVNASTSLRTELPDSSPSLLLDPDCPPPPSPPSLPTVPSDCIEDVGIWRRYWALIPETSVSVWSAMILTTEIETGAAAARQVRIRVYANPENEPVYTADTSEWISEQILSYVPPNTVMTLDGVSQRAWAIVGGQGPISADHLLYGTAGTPPTWPALSCGFSYIISFDVPIDAPEANLQTRAFLTERS